MKVIEGLIQGSDQWHAHRARHFNASDAPAMLGCSPYKTRDALIREIATGLGEEFTPEQQKRMEDGHVFEKLARPLAEEILGQDLYPLTATDGPYSASFDGLPMDESVNWEHKSLNDRLRAVLPVEGIGDESVGARLDKDYRVQMEQQSMIAGCERSLFTASKWRWDDEAHKYVLVEARHCWYRTDPALRAEIVAGWSVLEQDVAAYQTPEVVDRIEVVGHRPDQLPALRSTVKGELVLDSNIKEWEAAAFAFIKRVRDHELKTDEDFANAAEAADWCESSKTTLMGVRANLMSATGDVNVAVATLDRIAAELDKTRTTFTKAIKERREARKTELVVNSQTLLRDHLDALTKRVGQPVTVVADFAGVLKNLKSFASMESKLSSELARAKIDANRVADLIDGNRKAMDASDAGHLFPDFAQVCTKTADDFANLITSRRAAAQARADAERERIRAEEAARLEREQRAEAERKAREDAEAQAAAERAARITEAQGAQQVLKAEPETADATDRAVPAITGPSVGSMGAGQPADAGPIGGTVRQFHPTAAASRNEQPTLTLGEIKTRIAPLSIDAAGLESLGFHAKKERGACLYRNSDWPAIHAALVKKLTAAGPQQLAA